MLWLTRRERLPTLSITHASGGASTRIARVTCQLVQNITTSAAMIWNDCCSITLAASMVAWATWSLSEPSRTSIDGTGSVSKRRPGRPRYLPSTFTRMSRARSEEHPSELQSLMPLVCRLLLEIHKKYHQE